MPNRRITDNVVGQLTWRESEAPEGEQSKVMTNAHRIETLVRQTIITRCGRRMAYHNQDGWLKFADELDFTDGPIRPCEDCH